MGFFRWLFMKNRRQTNDVSIHTAENATTTEMLAAEDGTDNPNIAALNDTSTAENLPLDGEALSRCSVETDALKSGCTVGTDSEYAEQAGLAEQTTSDNIFHAEVPEEGSLAKANFVKPPVKNNAIAFSGDILFGSNIKVGHSTFDAQRANLEMENSEWRRKQAECQARMEVDARRERLEREEINELKQAIKKEKREYNRLYRTYDYAINKKVFCEFIYGEYCSKYDFSPVDCSYRHNEYGCSWYERHLPHVGVQYNSDHDEYSEYKKRLTLYGEFYYDYEVFNKDVYQDILDYMEYIKEH